MFKSYRFFLIDHKNIFKQESKLTTKKWIYKNILIYLEQTLTPQAVVTCTASENNGGGYWLMDFTDTGPCQSTFLFIAF